MRPSAHYKRYLSPIKLYFICLLCVLKDWKFNIVITFISRSIYHHTAITCFSTVVRIHVYMENHLDEKMPEVFIDRKTDLQLIELSTRNKFKWSWLEEKDNNGDLLSDYFRKIPEAGIGFCLFCCVRLNYGARGKAFITRHAQSKHHVNNRKNETKSIYSLPPSFQTLRCLTQEGISCSVVRLSHPYGDTENHTSKHKNETKSKNSLPPSLQTLRHSKQGISCSVPSLYHPHGKPENILDTEHHPVTEIDLKQEASSTDTEDDVIVTVMKQETRCMTLETENMTQETESTAQETETMTDSLTQKTDTTIEETVNMSQETENLSQETENMFQETESIPQETETTTQKIDSATLETESMSQEIDNTTLETEGTTREIRLREQEIEIRARELEARQMELDVLRTELNVRREQEQHWMQLMMEEMRASRAQMGEMLERQNDLIKLVINHLEK